ncbi:hypothetical protein MUN89_18570 [Halobacillus salinarum]|uniref:Uncharacterized protein n=1 Tax=Halobacillus salinarum TaxID=2932257 RepID=A0ABY4EII7_9BACI|nr:hypothetical protein [Halobacillus salinarum]UOQ43857.1 hypothetical protein MUN89_18570 [Halobacillus salinarum]
MKISTLLKWITGIAEALLAIPVAGGLFILSTGWGALMFMFVLHLITLIFSIREQRFSSGSILGLITSMVGAIPIVGWLMHSITALVLLIDGALSMRTEQKVE